MSIKQLAALLAISVACGGAFADKPEGKGKPADKGTPDLPSVLDTTPAPGNANVHSVVSNVPEAETWALAVVGAAVVGGVAWRRRKDK